MPQVDRPYPLPSAEARRLGLKRGIEVLVVDVAEDRPDNDAGVEPGDAIVEVNCRPVASPADFRRALARRRRPPSFPPSQDARCGPRHECASEEQHGRQPDPAHLARQDGQALGGHERSDPNGRHLDRLDGEEVANVAERREEGHAATAVGQRVEDAVGGRGDEEVEPQCATAPARSASREDGRHCQRRQEGGERERMSEAPVTEHVAVVDAEPETQDVEVGECGADGTCEPDPRETERAAKPGSDRCSGQRMRQDRGHPFL